MSNANQEPEFILLDKELIKGLTEKDVEIDHLKTVVVALQEKIVVIDDMKQDVVEHKSQLKHSEEKRHELQVHITETSIKIHEDTVTHTSYH